MEAANEELDVTNEAEQWLIECYREAERRTRRDFVAALKAMEKGERNLMRNTAKSDARLSLRYRERADALAGAISALERLPATLPSATTPS